MKIVVPDYYAQFKCIADKCQNTCCKGWEIEIDEESLKRFEKYPGISQFIEKTDDNHFALKEGEVCPFLRGDGLCDMILEYGEDMLCQTCADHPRFRNYWTDRIEMGLGIVCEEAARLILSKDSPMKLVILSDDGDCEGESASGLPEDEEWLLEVRNEMLEHVEGAGPIARLKEYLIYRHIADALYDDRLEERILFIEKSVAIIEEEWQKTDGSIESLVKVARSFSYDIEYDEDEKEKIMKG